MTTTPRYRSMTCARWPSAGAGPVRAKIIVMPWTMPMPVTFTAVLARAITPTAHVDRSSRARQRMHLSGNLRAWPQSP